MARACASLLPYRPTLSLYLLVHTYVRVDTIYTEYKPAIYTEYKPATYPVPTHLRLAACLSIWLEVRGCVCEISPKVPSICLSGQTNADIQSTSCLLDLDHDATCDDVHHARQSVSQRFYAVSSVLITSQRHTADRLLAIIAESSKETATNFDLFLAKAKIGFRKSMQGGGASMRCSL
eukprot:6196436-Pleurochrysis_carterae.AAC.1